MLDILALAAAVSATPIVSGDWLQAHLLDAQVRVIYVGDRGDYDRSHVPGARIIDHMETVSMTAGGHRLASNDVLARTLTKAGAADGARIVLYGDSPMATGWVNTAIAVIGHGDDVSWLDGGIALWTAENRPTSTKARAPGTGPLTVRPSTDFIVDAAWLRNRLDPGKTKTRVLDVRTQDEWNGGHLPNATLILWQDLFTDVKTQRFRSLEEIRGVLTKAGVGSDQDVVTYCAVGMRASLMYWAARWAGVPAHLYLGSWQDWSRNAANPIAR
jgi:thiosulfate/3-mercaptopyruvate sulfurtransferase